MDINQIILHKNVPCQMRDGVTLYADVYRPDREGQFPVLLTRLPYNKDLPFYSHRYLDTNRLVQNGYVVIIQDVRGRYSSEGDFYPFIHEAEDGFDTVEWAAALPYSNGEVGMFGLSYYGFTQLLAAAEKPPHLKAIAPAMTLANWRKNSVESGGKFLVGSAETWALESVVPDELKRKYGNSNEYKKMMEQMANFYNEIEEWYKFMPINEWPPLKEMGAANFFFEMLDADSTETDWGRASIEHKYNKIEVPALHIAGWYDNFLHTTIQNYVEMENYSHPSQKIIIGAWGHGVFSNTLGERNFGIHASGEWIDKEDDLTGLHIRWFDHWLKEKEEFTKEDAPIKLFVMGINEWRNEKEWPLARTKYEPFYFHSEGKANTRYGNGGLSVEPPLNEPADQFLYDPKNPVPTSGGGTLFAGSQTMGPRDQSKIEEREDVLVYTSEPLQKDLEVTGPVKVRLWAKTDAEDTDFTAKLIDVFPDGTAYNLTDGIIRAKYRNGMRQEEKIKGEILQYNIDLWATSNVFKKGHRIRVEISSSNFPRFDMNLNTGESMITCKEMKVANQTIYHQKEYPSHIILPVIPY